MKFNIPETRWLIGKDVDARRILFTASQIRRGFYKEKGFVVLPEPIEGRESGVVVLPKLNYQSVDNFWEAAATFDPEEPMVRDTMVAEVTSLLKGSSVHADELNRIKRKWREIENFFWEYVAEVVPEELAKFEVLEVWVSAFGTVSSANQNLRHVKCFLRTGVSLGQLAAMIVTTLVRMSTRFPFANWEESERLVDYLMTHPKMRKIFPDYKPTLQGVMKTPVSLRDKSDKYLKSLGMTYLEKEFEVKNNKVT